MSDLKAVKFETLEYASDLEVYKFLNDLGVLV